LTDVAFNEMMDSLQNVKANPADEKWNTHVTEEGRVGIILNHQNYHELYGVLIDEKSYINS
jgi:hypothetical protein